MSNISLTQPKKLWRRESASWIVEILVGTVWVQHTPEPLSTYEKALKEAQLMQRDVSVLGTRIIEHTVVHTAAVVYAYKKDAAISKLPPKMRPTEDKQDCPACKAPNQIIGDDGNHRWVFCSKCDRACPAA